MMKKLGLCLLSLALLATQVASQPVVTPPPFVPTVQVPGVSQALFSNPYYKCNTNYFVSTTGSDGAAGTSLGTAWATLQHAANTVNSGTGSGSWCINVAPGTYAQSMSTGQSGTTASPTGYIVYRCGNGPTDFSNMGQCIITDAGNEGNNGALSVNGRTSSNPLVGYLWFDGFTLNSASGLQTQFGNGMGQQTTNPSLADFCCHHIWYTNNTISGYGQSGIQSAQSDFVYVVHNTIFNNSSATSCDASAQGSGYSQAVPWPIPGAYTLTADDKSNSVVGNMAAPNGTTQYFQQVVMWNLIHNNWIETSGPCTSTDGNGIIFDTWGCINNSVTLAGCTVYQHQALAAFNLMYNNGGSGFKIQGTDAFGRNSPNVGVVVANNTSFNDALESTGTAFSCSIEDLGDGSNSGGNSDLFINNVVYAFIPTGNPKSTCDYSLDSGGGNTYFFATGSNNISTCNSDTAACSSPGGSGGMFHNATFSATNQTPSTDPKWVNVGGIGGGSAGSVTTPPSSTNFALQGTSPAIGYGLTKSYLPPQSVDAGACHHALATCP